MIDYNINKRKEWLKDLQHNPLAFNWRDFIIGFCIALLGVLSTCSIFN